MLVRRANGGDIEAITRLWKEMMLFHIDHDPIYEMKPDAQELFISYAASCIEDPEKRVFVCCEGKEVAGYAMAQIGELPPVYLDTRIGEIESICVTEKYRRKGAAKGLVEECEKWFRERGVKRAECMVSLKNPLSQAFWESCGYAGYNKQCFKRL